MENIASMLFSLASSWETEVERTFNCEFMHDWMERNGNLFFLSVAVYLCFCYFGIKFMENKKRFDLRIPLAMWNAFLSVFSTIGMLRTAPVLIGKLLTESFENTICADATEAYGNGTVGFWTMLFILSKVPELFDTVFIVLRKRQLIVLHWYHHASVLLYCWHAYTTRAGSGLYFVAMNYSVHAFMYGYFCLQALRVMPKWFPSYLITIFQITQMIIGTFVCASAWYYHMNGRDCKNDKNNLIAGAIMYASYLLFFLEFAITKFVLPPKKTKSA
eukprot:CAMPEP_0185041530 /NCGR_PEP_ID=MMETSP1103-20130426/40960_1 /TAXON_ID=36769 /ORGANISM="Paraphysomonas bandaiensis, Strain Caron Lab Isolate" /LENGTH=273 /DNA_ID=CAMNT_0027581301 /DNA_START=1 /DNA_END=822 /DNA_ORIENTATION=+